MHHGGQGQRSGWTTAGVVALAASLGFFLMVLVLSILGGNSVADPQQLLEETQEFLDEAETVRYRGTGVDVIDPGTDFEDGFRYRMRAEAEFPDLGRVTMTEAGYWSETVFVGDVVYDRAAESRRELADTKFARYDLREMEVDPEFGAFASDAALDVPNRLSEILDDARRPRNASSAKGGATAFTVDLPRSVATPAGFARSAA